MLYSNKLMSNNYTTCPITLYRIFVSLFVPRASTGTN